MTKKQNRFLLKAYYVYQIKHSVLCISAQ